MKTAERRSSAATHRPCGAYLISASAKKQLTCPMTSSRLTGPGAGVSSAIRRIVETFPMISALCLTAAEILRARSFSGPESASERSAA